MKVLVLCKRRYTGKDLLADRYGRLFELPEALARRGHSVSGVALSYRSDAQAGIAGLVQWNSATASPAGLADYVTLLRTLMVSERPDVLWVSSDVVHAAVGALLSRRSGVPLVIDLYDDYEAFGLTRLPGATWLLRRSCRMAAGLSIVSHELRRKVDREYATPAELEVLGNGVRHDLFMDRSRGDARRAFGLPADSPLVGTIGSLTRDRGIGDLLDAFQRLRSRRPDARLVLAGPRDSSFGLEGMVGVHWLGELPLDRAAIAMSALDVVAVCNRDTMFGRACFPLKLVEAIASRRPVVAAAVGDVRTMLCDTPSSLYTPGDAAGLAAALESQLDRPMIAPRSLAPDWDHLGGELERFLERVAFRRDARNPQNHSTRTSAIRAEGEAPDT